MCYAIPGRVVAIKDEIAIIDYFGEHRKVLNDLSELNIGDYVYAQGGMIIQKIDAKEAMIILKVWKERLSQLKEIDLQIIRKENSEISNKKLECTLEKAKEGKPLLKEELLSLLNIENKKDLEILYNTANSIRQKNLNNSCCVHGIIEFSNYCRNDCRYCGIRSSNQISRYRMGVDEIVTAADYAVNKLKFKALVLQSGEDQWYTTEKLIEIIKKIKEKCGVLLFMSVGERSMDCCKKMYIAGARGILSRFETSNQDIYKNIHIGQKADFKKRVKMIKDAGKIGYLIATGSLIGLPGQTKEDVLNDILLTADLNAEMYSFGPLIPHPATPLAQNPKVNIDDILKAIAVSRLSNPNAKILVTTALETLNKDCRRLGLLAGANSLMINVTPEKYKGLYSIYPSKEGADKTVLESIGETLKLLYSLGRAPIDLGL